MVGNQWSEDTAWKSSSANMLLYLLVDVLSDVLGDGAEARSLP